MNYFLNENVNPLFLDNLDQNTRIAVFVLIAALVVFFFLLFLVIFNMTKKENKLSGGGNKKIKTAKPEKVKPLKTSRQDRKALKARAAAPVGAGELDDDFAVGVGINLSEEQEKREQEKIEKEKLYPKAEALGIDNPEEHSLTRLKQLIMMKDIQGVKPKTIEKEVVSTPKISEPEKPLQHSSEYKPQFQQSVQPAQPVQSVQPVIIQQPAQAAPQPVIIQQPVSDNKEIENRINSIKNDLSDKISDIKINNLTEKLNELSNKQQSTSSPVSDVNQDAGESEKLLNEKIRDIRDEFKDKISDIKIENLRDRINDLGKQPSLPQEENKEVISISPDRDNNRNGNKEIDDDMERKIENKLNEIKLENLKEKVNELSKQSPSIDVSAIATQLQSLKKEILEEIDKKENERKSGEAGKDMNYDRIRNERFSEFAKYFIEDSKLRLDRERDDIRREKDRLEHQQRWKEQDLIAREQERLTRKNDNLEQELFRMKRENLDDERKRLQYEVEEKRAQIQHERKIILTERNDIERQRLAGELENKIINRLAFQTAEMKQIANMIPKNEINATNDDNLLKTIEIELDSLSRKMDNYDKKPRDDDSYLQEGRKTTVNLNQIKNDGVGSKAFSDEEFNYDDVGISSGDDFEDTSSKQENSKLLETIEVELDLLNKILKEKK